VKVPEPLLAVVRALGALNEDVVFVGGMIGPLLVTDPAASAPRPTDDVDLIIDTNRAGYYAFGEKLRARGFRELSEPGAPMCRWILGDLKVDVMPIDPAILGFTNVWYAGAHAAPSTVGTGEDSVRFLDAPRFCATKLESFASRGQGDLYHHDLEDFIAVVDTRVELLEEVRRADDELREFLAEETASLLAQPSFREALPGHLQGDFASQGRLPALLGRLRGLAALKRQQPLKPAPSSRTRRGLGTLAPTYSAIPPMALRHTFVRSSNLRDAYYDLASETLIIDFKNGSRYSYASVPSTVFSGLTRAASAGRFHHQWIRRRYAYQRVA
jgi:hypothetical protein